MSGRIRSGDIPNRRDRTRTSVREDRLTGLVQNGAASTGNGGQQGSGDIPLLRQGRRPVDQRRESLNRLMVSKITLRGVDTGWIVIGILGHFRFWWGTSAVHLDLGEGCAVAGRERQPTT